MKSQIILNYEWKRVDGATRIPLRHQEELTDYAHLNRGDNGKMETTVGKIDYIGHWNDTKFKTLEDEVVSTLYGCDAWHTHQSKYLLGVFTNDKDLKDFISKHSKKSEEGELGKDDWANLSALKQTQCRSDNYLIEEEEVNPISE